MKPVGQRSEQRHSQTLVPRLQQAVRLLQLPSLDFALELRELLGRNPFLEADETVDSNAEDEAETENESDAWPGDPAVGSGSTAPDRDWLAAEASLGAHLCSQLRLVPLGERELALAQAIAESLDDDGYLRIPLTELLGLLPLDPPATLAELRIALCRVQSLEPAGVGARDLAECLRLQLPLIEDARMRDLAHTIVGDHLNALAARDLPGLARRLGETPAAVQAVCERIRGLDPHPGWRCGPSFTAYAVPDVIVQKRRGEWQVQLNPAILPRVRLNRACAELYRRHRGADCAALGAELQEARWMMRNVEQRFATILGVAQAIVKRQRHFFDVGDMAMKPLGLREIADELGIHASTASRVTNNKYMATPRGVFELRYFFSRALHSSSGQACSGTAIRGLIRDIIAAEPGRSPLSDMAIARLLKQQGLPVARRTVTKYRQMLHIGAVGRRLRHPRD